MKMKKLILTCLSLVLVCSMTACAAKPNGAPTAPKEEEFTLQVGIPSDPVEIDAATSYTSLSFTFLNYLFEGLMNSEKRENNVAITQVGQAKSYSLSEDGLTYQFILRDDIFWSDGKPVVAEDFVYSWQRLVDPATKSSYASLISMIENAEEILKEEKSPSELAVKAIDEKTFEVKLSQKCTYFDEICATPPTFPVRKDMVEAGGEKWYKNPETLICNGAYTLENWEADDKLVLVKNPKYYDVKEIGPDRLNFTVIGDKLQAQSLFTNKRLDAMYDISKDTAANMKGTEQLLSVPTAGLRMVYMNNQKYPFDDVNVRKAFSLAIDRDAFSDDQTTPLAAFVPYGITDPSTGQDFRKSKESYFSVNSEDYAANCEEAKNALAEAGFKNGENFPAVRFVFVNTEYATSIAETVAKSWEEVLGVKVEMTPLDITTWLSEVSAGNYNLSSESWVADYNDPTTFLNLFESTNTFNTPNYNNPLYDAALKEAADATTEEGRFSALHKAEDIMFADHAVAPLYYTNSCYLLQNNITGAESSMTEAFSLKHVKRAKQ